MGSLAFWADGKTLAVALADYSPMQLWDVQYLVNTPQYLCGLLRNQSMTSTQWMADSSGVPYQNTCP